MEAVYLKAAQKNTSLLFTLFEHAATLKSVRRSGWHEKLGLDNAESVADHSYVATLMAVVYADMMGLDASKTARMSLLHDLAESITGDITPEAMPRSQKSEKEDDAMSTILEMFPKEIRQKYADAWAEYRDADSPESALLKQVDKLEMALQAKRYAKSGPHDIESFLSTARQCVSNPALQGMLDVQSDD